jgi:uncharacterized protein
VKLVLDTNVLVSAVLADGVCRRLLALAPQRRIELLFSPATVDEFLHTMANPRFKLPPTASKQILALDLLPFAQVVQTKATELPFPCSDPTDDKFLHCAVQGQANALISGDKALLALAGKYPFEIQAPGEWLRSR